MEKQKLRRVGVSSHHFYMEGYYHGTITYSKRNFGKEIMHYTDYHVEDERGTLHKFDVKTHGIKFLEPLF